MYSTVNKEDNLSNLKTTAQNVRDAASDTATEVRQDMREAANRAGRRVRSFLNTAGDEIGNATDTVSDQIRSKPLQSSLIALGIGVVLGSLMRR